MNKIDIVGMIYDNSMEHTVGLASQIYDENYNGENQGLKQDVINSQQKAINTELRRDIDDIRQNGTSQYKLVVLTQQEYNELQEYDENTLYFITRGDDWVFGDRLPVVFS